MTYYASFKKTKAIIGKCKKREAEMATELWPSRLEDYLMADSDSMSIISYRAALLSV